MGRRALLTLALFAIALAAGHAPAAAAERDLASYVNPMVGTFPPGFVFPGPAAPFGMVQNSPDTTGEFAYSGYLATDPIMRGFSLVHLSGPGVKKAGDLPFMPTVGPEMSNDPNQYASTYSHAREKAEAGYYSVHLDKYATDVELTASTRAAMQRYTFPPSPFSNVVMDVSRSVEGVHNGHFEVTGRDEVSGWARGRYPVFFVARFSRPFAASGTFRRDGPGAGGWVRFDTLSERTVTARIGVSFVDEAGARRNLEAEAPTFDFEGMRARTRAAWNRELAVARLDGGSETDRTSFYTALYHAQLHPNVFTDVDGRYRGADDKVHTAEGRTHYANFSSWDTYKGQNQMLALMQPRRYREMLLSLLATYRETGKLPRWGEQSIDAAHMSGDPVIPMITDAFCRGLLDDATADGLYEGAVNLTTRRDPALASLGYLPGRAGTTLEYGVADFALALMADGLGRSADSNRWLGQSLVYRNLLDPETRWIRPRDAQGNWRTPFQPTDEEGFQEGNSWQYSWLAPHDARGLFDRMGGDGTANERLDILFAGPPDVQNVTTGFGTQYKTNQYAPGNEHDIQVPWMFSFGRRPHRGAEELREIQGIFRPTPDGLPGNDDLGSLSGWHVMSALGFGPVTPGAPFYVIGSPQFEGATIDPAGAGRPFRVEAPGASLTNKYVRGARLGGRALGRSWFEETALRRGETLRLDMGSEPNPAWATSAAAVPPSVTGSSLSGFGCSRGAAAGNAANPAGTTVGGRRGGTSTTTGGRQARIRLLVTPRRVRAGRRMVLRVRAKQGRRILLRGVTVTVGRHRARTRRDGRATFKLLPRRAGLMRIRATKRGMRTARVAVRVLRPR